jgi:hypothetical protein
MRAPDALTVVLTKTLTVAERSLGAAGQLSVVTRS